MIDQMRHWMMVCEAAAPHTFDPQRTERGKASFLFVDGDFVPVPYQSHLNVLGKLFSTRIPNSNEWGSRAEVYDELQKIAVQRGIVQGDFQPGEPKQSSHGASLRSTMMLCGTLKDCRKAYTIFRRRYPDLMAQIEAISYVVMDANGKQVHSEWLEGLQIDRKFGNRSRPSIS